MFLVDILHSIATLWYEMGIYLVFGFAVAGVLSRLLKSETIVRHLGGNGLSAVVKASLFGVPLPLCSCGVIPVGLSLFKRGASRAATTSFLISTPQTGVDSILVTYALLGPVFAVVRPVAAFLNGLFGGLLVALFPERAPSPPPPAPAPPPGSPEAPAPVGFRRNLVLAFRYGFVEFPREITGWLVIGIVAAGLLSHFLPQGFIAEHIGGGWKAMALMALLGIPLYICATASVPFVAVLVVQGGLSAGAALVFMMTGPATNVASLILLARTLGRRTTGLYLFSIVCTSFLFGFLLDGYYAGTGTALSVEHAAHHHEEILPAWLGLAGAVGLAAIVLGVWIGKALDWNAARKETPAMDAKAVEKSLEIAVEGMTCANCARHVAEAARAVPGVASARVDLARGLLHVVGESPDRAALVRAVEAAGYGCPPSSG